MKTKLLFFSVLLFSACHPTEQVDVKAINTDTDTAVVLTEETAVTDSSAAPEDLTQDEQMQECFVVIAGSSQNFSVLNKDALKLSKKAKIEYDHTSLVYDEKKGMIVPDTTVDEIYVGQYYPRRYEENKISIEMLWYYQGEQNDTLKDMAIVTGIHGNKEEAEKQLEFIKPFAKDAYILKTKIYMGCMH